MPEHLRTAVNFLRRFVGERRRATRTPVRLPVTVSPQERSAGEYDDEVPSLNGYTRDLSATGLALILPAVHIGGRYLTGEGRTLRIRLGLPSGEIKLRAAPVRYERLEGDRGTEGYLIGAHITEMSDADRARFDEYLRNFGRR